MKRRLFLGSTIAGGAALGAGMTAIPGSALAKKRKDPVVRENGKYDLLLAGGHVIDPANGIDGKKTDVAISGGKIAAVGKKIDPMLSKKTIDVSGLYVTPGFIDIHAHVYWRDDNPSYRWVAADDLCWPSGVTTVVDPGSSGAGTFEGMKKIIDESKTRTLALINVSYTGMDEGEQDPSQFKIRPMVEIAKAFPKDIVGYKTAHYWTGQPFDSVHTPWASVDALVEAGRQADLPVMFDFFPRPASGGFPERSYRDLILKKGRPGDIHTHCYARHIPVIGADGSVNPDIFRAQEKGFIFDLGHGGGSFVYRNAAPAFKQGYLPNTISTDLHCFNTCGPVINMAFVMTKCLNLGMTLNQVIERSTVNPARVINRPELGTLTTGNPADVAVFEIVKGDFSFVDTSGGRNYGDKMIRNIMTVAEGRVGFDPFGLSYPHWESVPKDQSYWQNPSGIDH